MRASDTARVSLNTVKDPANSEFKSEVISDQRETGRQTEVCRLDFSCSAASELLGVPTPHNPQTPFPLPQLRRELRGLGKPSPIGEGGPRSGG